MELSSNNFIYRVMSYVMQDLDRVLDFVRPQVYSNPKTGLIIRNYWIKTNMDLSVFVLSLTCLRFIRFWKIQRYDIMSANE